VQSSGYKKTLIWFSSRTINVSKGIFRNNFHSNFSRPRSFAAPMGSFSCFPSYYKFLNFCILFWRFNCLQHRTIFGVNFGRCLKNTLRMHGCLRCWYSRLDLTRLARFSTSRCVHNNKLYFCCENVNATPPNWYLCLHKAIYRFFLDTNGWVA